MNFGNIFSYIELALSVGGAVQTTIAEFAAAGPTAPVTGAQLQAVWGPVVLAVQSVFPKAAIPPALVTDICNAVADAVAQYLKK